MERSPNRNWDGYHNGGFVQQGWQCPVCGKVHAPWVAGCDCHRVTVVTSAGHAPVNEPQTTHEIQWEHVESRTPVYGGFGYHKFS